MPRPKVNPDETLKLELRITPPDGNPIEDWKLGEDFVVLLAGQEGGTEGCRLHYHCYVETKRSRSWLTKWIYSIAHCNNGETGNSVFFTRAPHEHTIGYVVKEGVIVCRQGCSDTFISEWLTKSSQYRKDAEADKQRKKRVEKSFTHQIRDTIATQLRESVELRNPRSIVSIIMNEYQQAGKIFPNRSTMENLVVTLMYPFDPSAIESYYVRSFSYDYS